MDIDIRVKPVRGYISPHKWYLVHHWGENSHWAYVYDPDCPVCRRVCVEGRAEQVLCMHLPFHLRIRYLRTGLFFWRGKKGVWIFIHSLHFPVKLDTGEERWGLCIDNPEVPTADFLLQCFLEVRGGREDELFEKAHRIGEHNRAGRKRVILLGTPKRLEAIKWK